MVFFFWFSLGESSIIVYFFFLLFHSARFSCFIYFSLQVTSTEGFNDTRKTMRLFKQLSCNLLMFCRNKWCVCRLGHDHQRNCPLTTRSKCEMAAKPYRLMSAAVCLNKTAVCVYCVCLCICGLWPPHLIVCIMFVFVGQLPNFIIALNSFIHSYRDIKQNVPEKHHYGISFWDILLLHWLYEWVSEWVGMGVYGCGRTLWHTQHPSRRTSCEIVASDGEGNAWATTPVQEQETPNVYAGFEMNNIFVELKNAHSHTHAHYGGQHYKVYDSKCST